ncbi:MAG: hypothetical protein Terrestrivirus2_131 [Terrestrivirus sp.]|uniref:Bro-N domain-containing protein n=1 Tax=Terrestrivirus sp. TaxID=2487775 RepID=A0A3G4ZPU1_9VIRU|nr:MAG: hypothetical protein Terrestrivirus2_131 [Terrestrivirus sp.]
MLSIVDFTDPMQRISGSVEVLKQGNKIWFKGASLAKALGYKDTVSAIHRHIDKNHKKDYKSLIKNDANITYKINKKIDPQTIFIDKEGLITLLLETKLTNVDTIAKQFGIETLYRYKRKEIEIIDELCIFFNEIGCRHEIQYVVDNYKIDLYILAYKLAIEIDEYNHNDRNKNDEQIRENYLRNKLECEFIRVNPHDKNFSIPFLISLIHKHMSAVDIINVEDHFQNKIKNLFPELEKYKIEKLTEIEKFRIEKQFEFELEKYKIDKQYIQSNGTCINNKIPSIINTIEQCDHISSELNINPRSNTFTPITKNVASKISDKKPITKKSSKNKEDSLISNNINSMVTNNEVNKNEVNISSDSSNNLQDIKPIKINVAVSKCSCGSFKSSNSAGCKQCERIILYEKLIEHPKYVGTHPDYEQLKKDLVSLPYIWIGKKYGCSDNNIRKWVKKFEKNNQIK